MNHNTFAIFANDAPDIWDNSACTIEGPNLDFALSQCDEEITSDCLSPSFSSELLPGMYSMPIGVIPKPHLTNLHLVPIIVLVIMHSTASSCMLTPVSNLTIYRILAQPCEQSLQSMEDPPHGFSNQIYAIHMCWQAIQLHHHCSFIHPGWAMLKPVEARYIQA